MAYTNSAPANRQFVGPRISFVVVRIVSVHYWKLASFKCRLRILSHLCSGKPPIIFYDLRGKSLRRHGELNLCTSPPDKSVSKCRISVAKLLIRFFQTKAGLGSVFTVRYSEPSWKHLACWNPRVGFKQPSGTRMHRRDDFPRNSRNVRLGSAKFSTIPQWFMMVLDGGKWEKKTTNK